MLWRPLVLQRLLVLQDYLLGSLSVQSPSPSDSTSVLPVRASSAALSLALSSAVKLVVLIVGVLLPAAVFLWRGHVMEHLDASGHW